MFFFSSRRRHTRWPRDWSSDVCSSDVLEIVRVHGRGEARGEPGTAEVGRDEPGRAEPHRRLPRGPQCVLMATTGILTATTIIGARAGSGPGGPGLRRTQGELGRAHVS